MIFLLLAEPRVGCCFVRDSLVICQLLSLRSIGGGDTWGVDHDEVIEEIGFGD